MWWPKLWSFGPLKDFVTISSKVFIIFYAQCWDISHLTHVTGSVAQVVMLFHCYASVSFKANKTEQGPTNKLSKGRQHTFISPPTYNILASWYLYFRFLRLIKCWCVSWFKGWNKPWNCDIVRDSRLLRLLSCLKCQYIPGYNKFTWGLQISSKMPSHMIIKSYHKI